jgi:hypothetical protein
VVQRYPYFKSSLVQISKSEFEKITANQWTALWDQLAIMKIDTKISINVV